MQIGFFTALALVFIILKLVDIIAWSWWLVLLPVLPGLIILAITLFGFLLVGVKVSKRRPY